ncbi:MAG: hypothetical protein ACXW11_06155 [Methylotenera sp.]
MANTNSTVNSNENKKTGFIDDARGMIALGATYEIESLLLLMIESFNKSYREEDTAIDPLAMKGVAMRIKQLNSVLMSAVGDDSENNRSLNARC